MHETEAALLAADSALVLVHGVAGIEVQTEKVWSFCEKYSLPRALVINQLDRDRASFERTLEALRGAYGRAVIPVHLPIGEERNFRGLVDLVSMKAYLYDPDGSGKGKETEIPADLQDAATAAHEALVEMVAEGNDKLMEEFFDKGTVPVEDLVPGLKQAVGEKRILPRSGFRRSAEHRQRYPAELPGRLFSFTPGERRGGGSRSRGRPTRETQDRRLPTGFGLRIQNCCGSLRRPGELFQSDLGSTKERGQPTNFNRGHQRASVAHRNSAGQNPDPSGRTPCW